MQTLKIKKKSGGYRTVVAPDAKQKEALRAALPALNILQLALCDPEVVHGCIPGGNAVSGASRHIGFEFTLCADLEAFFDSVYSDEIHKRYVKFQTWLPPVAQAWVTTDDKTIPGSVPGSTKLRLRAAQGLPTSPALANLRARDLDRSFVLHCKQRGIVYTRYVDDLAFSSNNREALLELRDLLPDIIERHGLKLNAKKTRVLWAGSDRSWRRHIYGVAVGNIDCKPTRRARRKMRAAYHQGRRPGYHRECAKGMREWMKLKRPRAAEIVLVGEDHKLTFVDRERAKKLVLLPAISNVLAQSAPKQKQPM